MQRGRRIAFDYGDVRIGVATSDADSIICSPLTTLKASDKSLLKSISEIFLEIEPVQIFVGRPALLSGQDGIATDKAIEFAQLLRAITDVEVVNTNAGSFDSGNEVVVLGWDPADTHTDNFWEELVDTYWCQVV